MFNTYRFETKYINIIVSIQYTIFQNQSIYYQYISLHTVSKIQINTNIIKTIFDENHKTKRKNNSELTSSNVKNLDVFYEISNFATRV